MKMPRRPWYPPTKPRPDIFGLHHVTILAAAGESNAERRQRVAKVEAGVAADFKAAVHHLGVWVIAVPVAGSLVVGLMARYGSEKIRGHGIPEALEAILLRGSRIEPRVALLKPLSAAISIGSGGPFALAAARALVALDLPAEEIARRAMKIAADICIYTNENVVIESLESP